jgi:hypothetical protein
MRSKKWSRFHGYEWRRKLTLGMSLALSAASAKVVPPRKLGSASEALVVPYWPGRGTEGMTLGLAASSGIVVPSLAMSKRSPPLLRPDSGDIVTLRVSEWLELRFGRRWRLLMRE